MSRLGRNEEEVQAEYIAYRRRGYSRDRAVQALTARYRDELSDCEDAPAVVGGIVRALCQKREMTSEIAEQLHQFLSIVPDETEKLLRNPTFYGREAVYRRRRSFDPQWQNGDLFSHKIVTPKAEKLGLSGWSVLFYRIGSYEDEAGERAELVYLSLCPTGCEPQSAAQLWELGFLRMMCHGERWDYMGQLRIKSRRALASYGLKKIGNFPGVLPPDDRTEEHPAVAMPIFDQLKKDAAYPDFEDTVCSIVKYCRRRNIPYLSTN